MVYSGAVVMKKAKPVRLDQKLYLKSKNLALNILLILDNTPRNPQDLCLTHPNTQLENLSNITTALPQPLISRGGGVQTPPPLEIILKF
jgi:hypothetical protein